MTPQFPQIEIIWPLIPFIQAFIWFIKSYWVLPKKSLNWLAILFWILFTFVYSYAYGLDFNQYQLLLTGILNWLTAIWFYKAAKSVLNPNWNNNGK